MPLLSRRLFTGSSKHLFFPKCPHSQASSFNPLRLLHHTHHQRLLLLLPKPLSGPLLSAGTSHDFLSVKPFVLFREVHLALRGYKVVRDPLALLRSKLEEKGILCGEMKLGLNTRELCPQVTPGELTVVTGVPNSGKSEWIDAMMCNINEREGWKFALCSMENKVQEHARRLLEKHIKKPFFTARYEKKLNV